MADRELDGEIRNFVIVAWNRRAADRDKWSRLGRLLYI